MRKSSIRRLASLAAVAVAALTGMALVATPAYAEPATGSIQWSFSAAFRAFLAGQGGTTTVGDGATLDAGTDIATFPLTDKTGDVVTAAGSTHYEVPGLFSVTQKNLRIDLATGTVIADIDVVLSGAPTSLVDSELATVSDPTTTGDATTFATVTLIPDGLGSLGSTFVSLFKTNLDPLTLTVVATPADDGTPTETAIAPPAAPQLPTTGADVTLFVAAGVALVVVGSALLLATRRRRKSGTAA